MGQARNRQVLETVKGMWMRCPCTAYCPLSEWGWMVVPAVRRASCTRSNLGVSDAPSTCTHTDEEMILPTMRW